MLVDRVNIGGNETGQQSNFASKGTRPQDASWTLDGVEVTDMAATGASPTYFNYDNFEEIQVSTAGNDIKARTGGIGLNMVIKRGTNQFRGSVRGYFDNEAMESSNVPDELKATGVTHETSDHNKQISDYGGELGGPIFRNKAWFYGSYSIQDVRLVRRAGALIDRTQLKNPNVKVNWQATKKDNISFLYLDGFKIKDGRSPGVSGILFDAPTATYHQDNAYEDTPFHGLWKVADDHVFGTKLFVSGLYAYYNTGFVLDPIGGLSEQAGRNFVTATSYGSVNQGLNVRPQHTATVNAQSFLNGFGGSHDVKFGFGWRRVDAISTTNWPGNMILAVERANNLQAQVFRQGSGGNRATYLDFYVGDTLSHDRWTLDFGLRFDRQDGEALPSETLANAAFPALVPGFVFAGYKTPFTWNDWSPRVGLTYALDNSRRTDCPGELHPRRRAAEYRHGRRPQPDLHRRIGDLPLGGPERRPLRAGQRGAGRPAGDHVGRRLQPGEPDLGDLGERARSRPARRRSRPASLPASITSCGRTWRSASTTATRAPTACSATSAARSRRASASRWRTTAPAAASRGRFRSRAARRTTCRPTSRARRRLPPAATASRRPTCPASTPTTTASR